MKKKGIDKHTLESIDSEDILSQDGATVVVPGELTRLAEVIVKPLSNRIMRYLMLIFGIVLFAVGGLFFYCSGRCPCH